MKIILLMAVLLTFITLACTPQPVIKTDPSEADIFFNNKYLGKSPVNFEDKSNDDIVIRAQKGECFGQQIIQQKKELVDKALSQVKDTAKEAISRLKGETTIPKEIFITLQCAAVKTIPVEARGLSEQETDR